MPVERGNDFLKTCVPEDAPMTDESVKSETKASGNNQTMEAVGLGLLFTASMLGSEWLLESGREQGRCQVFRQVAANEVDHALGDQLVSLNFKPSVTKEFTLELADGKRKRVTCEFKIDETNHIKTIELSR
jgi:hypothetical protein